MGIIAKQSIQGTVITYLGVAVSIVTTFVVMTRFLTAEEIGLTRVMVDTATLFIGFAQLGTSSSVIRFYPYFKTEDRRDHGFFFWSLIVPLVGFILTAVVMLLLKPQIVGMFEDKSKLFVDYFYYVLPLAFFMLYQTVFETNANVRMRIVFPRAVREVVIRILLLVIYLLYAYKWLTLDGFVVSLCGIYAVAMLMNIVFLFATNSVSLKPDFAFLKCNPTLVRRYVLYTGFLIVSALATVLAPLVSGFFVSSKMGLDYNGIFTIALNMAIVVCIPSRALNAIASPELSATFKDNNVGDRSTLLKRVSSNLFFIGCFILLMIWINVDLIFHILPNGSTYAVAKNTVLMLSVSQLLLSTFSIALNAINFSPYYFFSLICSAVLTAVTIVLNNALIPLYGIDGAAMANCLSYIIFFTLVLLVAIFLIHANPLSKSHLKSLVITLILFGFNELLIHCFPEWNIWLSAIVRDVVILGVFAFVAYIWNISEDINMYIKKIIMRF